MRLPRRCDVAGAVETDARVPGSLRFIRSAVTGGTVNDVAFDVLSGACITTRLHVNTSSAWGRTAGITTPEVLSEVRADVATVVGYVSRPVLAAALAERSHGRLHLDAAP